MSKEPKLIKELTPSFLEASYKDSPSSSVVQKILSITEEVRQEVLLPASRKLDELEIERKDNPGMSNADAKTVTIKTDKECEDALNNKLQAAFPDALIIGEEMFGAASLEDKQKLLAEALKTDQMVILTDALDGTRNFTQGGDGYATLVTALQGNKVIAAVVHRSENHSYTYSKGHTLTYDSQNGVRFDGHKLKPLSDRSFATEAKKLRGYAGFDCFQAMKEENNSAYPNLTGVFDSLSDLWTCSTMYTDLVTGQHHFMIIPPPTDLFDYPAGIELIQQAGGIARFLDGTDASFEELVKRQSFAKDTDEYKNIQNTLILAVSEGVFQTVSTQLLNKPKPPAPKPKPAP